MLLVVGELNLAPAVGLRDGGPHRGALPVRVHEHAPVDVSGRPADRLDEARLPAEEALLVGVEDRDEPDFGNVESLPEEVDADEDVVLAQPEVAPGVCPAKVVIVAGSSSSEEAKIAGITPAGFTLTGRFELSPP